MLRSDGKIWVLDNGQDHYTFSETDTDGMVVHRRGGVQYGLGVSSKFIASENSPKEMRPRWNTLLADGYKRNKMTEQDYGSLMTFDDLVFDEGPRSRWICHNINRRKHEILDISETTISGNKRAKLFFKNGYGVSVLFYQNNVYEVAVLKGVEDAWGICYNTPVMDDVIRCDRSSQIDDLMKKIQELKSDG